MEPHKNPISLFLKEQRDQLDVKQSVIAEDMGVSLSTLKRLEFGHLDVHFMSVMKALNYYGYSFAICPNNLEDQVELDMVPQNTLRS